MSKAIVTGHWNIPWLHNLPDHWEVVSSKRLFSTRKELARPDDEQLAATQAYGVIPQREYERRVGRRVVQITQNLEKRRHVERDDFIISMRSFEGGLERAWASGCIRSSYVVLKPSEAVHVGFFKHLLKSHDYIQALRATSNFIRDGQDLNMSNFSLVDLPLPPKAEQAIIARYLDIIDVQVRQFIRGKKKLIALLSEQKQAIIHHAVTRGIDPNVKLHPAGISWLGDVPDGWEVRRLRSISQKITSGSRGWSRYASDHGPLFVRIANLSRTGLHLRFEDVVRLALPASELGEAARTRIEAGDLLISITAYIGSVAVVPDDVGEAYVSQHVASCRLVDDVNRRWIGYVLLSPVGQAHGTLSMYGGTKQGLSLDDVKNYIILLPPREMQNALVTWIDAATRRVSELISSIENEIALIQEFRTRLIADVVTGKLDVRAAAASLPDTTELEPIDEPAEDEDLDDAMVEAETEEVAA
jgi:type I restriction enzyme S subunit